MRKGRRLRAFRLLILLVAVVLSACSGSGAADGGGNQPSDPALIAAGSELYAEACASCHGADLRGTERGPSHLSEVYEPGHHGDAAFLLAVRRGVTPHHWSFGPMPPIDGLSDSEVEALVAFVRDVQRREGFEPYPP
jgi:mono/diheme cytochrome c family protein